MSERGEKKKKRKEEVQKKKKEEVLKIFQISPKNVSKNYKFK